MSFDFENKACVLSAAESAQKIKRMAYEIAEKNHQATTIILVGIKNRGLLLASLLANQLQQITSIKIIVTHITINKKEPFNPTIEQGFDLAAFANEPIIVVDDVGNTGKTLLYAMKPFLGISFNSIQLAVLVDRMHKTFPIRPDFVGLSLATTLQEHIVVVFERNGDVLAFLN